MSRKSFLQFGRKALVIVIALMMIVQSLPLGLLPGQKLPKAVEAASSLTKTSQSDWMAGKYEYGEIDVATSSGDLKLQLDLGSWDASSPAYINHNMANNTKMLKVGRFLYLFRNRMTGQFLRLDLDSREWKEMAYVPGPVYEIADMTTNGTDTIWAFAIRYYGSAIYYLLKYDIPTNTWSYLTTTPNYPSTGATLEYVASQNAIYVARGGNTSEFWRYNITANTWTTLGGLTCTSNCDLAYDGSQYLYMASDASATDYFYRYDVTAGTWQARAAPPIDNAFSNSVDLVIIGDSIYTARGAGTRTFYKYSISGNSWTTVADLPAPTSYGSQVYEAETGKIITLGGIGQLWYYYPSTNSWSELAGPPTNAYDGTKTIAEDGAGNIYFCRGQNSASCYKYVISSNSWSGIASAPGNLSSGDSLVFTNGYLYVNRGGGGAEFYRYNPGDNTWATMTPVSATTSSGANMVASGSASIFFLRGGGTQTFYKYDIAGNSWTTKANIPEAVYYGGMAKAGDYIYALSGWNRGRFYRYNETANSWSELNSLPLVNTLGGGMAYDGGDYLYVQLGGDNDVWARQFYRYSISQDSWQRLIDTPAMQRYGGSIVWYNGNIYRYQGYAYGLWKYTPASGLNTYVTSGSWYSPVYDLTYVSSWGTFSATSSTPSGTSVTYYSRSSDNGNKWDDWTQISGGVIGSTARRYVQIKIVLGGDGASSPTVSDFTVNYNPDTTGPDLSSLSVSGYSANGGTGLISGSTYSHRHPYFSWTGAVDNQSGLDGYYVYFGSNASADPETLGAYQSTTNYTVVTGMVDSSSYYLRIKAKDKTGNTSSLAAGFTYVYSGISPPSTSTLTTQADWDNNEASKSAVYVGSSDWWNASYSYRKRVTVTNGASAVNAGITAKITFDSQALVSSSKMQADGDDLRMVYWDGNRWLELNRGVNNINTASTDVTFSLQKGIAASGSDNNYYLYYGSSSAVSPPAVTYSSDSVFKNINFETNQGDFGYASGNFSFYRDATVGYESSSSAKVSISNSQGSLYSLFHTYNSDEFAKVSFRYKTSGGNANFMFYVFQGATDRGWNYVRVNSVSETSPSYRLIGDITLTQDGQWHQAEFNLDTMLESVWGAGNYTIYQVIYGKWANFAAGTIWLDDFKIFGNQYLSGSLGSEEDFSLAADSDLTLESLPTGSWVGSQLPSLPYEMRMLYGAAVYAKGDLYVLRGNGTKTFYKLDMTNSSWITLPDAPDTIAGSNYAGAAMAFDGNDTIYVLRGGGTTGFYKYTISTSTWSSSLSAVPSTVYYGGALIKAGSDSLYALRGANAYDFYKYTISTNTWSPLANSPYMVNYGSGLAYDGNDTIWANTSFTNNVNGFARYTISTNRWDAPFPHTPYPIAGPSSNLVYDGSNYLYAFTSYDIESGEGNNHFVWRLNISANKWEEVSTTDFLIGYGAVAYDGSRYVYLVQGINVVTVGGTTAVARFDLQTQKFFPETPISSYRGFGNDSFGYGGSFSPYTGTSYVYDGSDKIYVLYNYTTSGSTGVYIYTISTKKWEWISDKPCLNYGSGVYANGNLYASCGNNTALFFRYNEATKNWTRLTDAPATLGDGGNQTAAFDGNDTIYFLRGRATTTLYKYTISTNTWATESSSVPATIGNSWGASITYDGSGNLYIARGNYTNSFYKYQISSQTWTTLTVIPGLVGYGSGSVYHNGKIYVLGGQVSKDFYIYDVSSNTWTRGPSTFSIVYAGGGLVKGAGNTLYAFQGYNFYTFWKYNIPTSSTSFKSSGSYTSKTFNLGNAYDWAGLSATVASPSATAISFETRTSTDSANWSSWVEATELKKIAGTNYTYNINSSVNRYFQVKITLNSEEGAETPTVSDLTLTYYKDDEAPVNPDTLNSYTTATKAATINTNTWYNHALPHFEWSGATDATGSGVLGYYVYFGQDENVDASVSGTLQTAVSYTASLTQDGEYYLKIKTKDNVGNINSSHWAPFHYRYDGTAPSAPSSVAADPRTYTASNNFTMFWTSATDTTSNATSSGLLGYYYKTATTSGVLSTDQLTTSTTLTGITAYQDGTNTFYVKASDNAGNTSDYTSTSYYYNGSAPSAPTNLAVSPSYSTSNSFAFDWDLPTSYEGSISEYRYSINSLPSATNYTAVNTSALTASSYATIKGTNVFYVVAVDEAGNVNYDAYASISFTADTSAPGIPLNPEAFDNSIRSTTQYKVGLTWDPPTDLGTGFAGYAIYGSSTATSCSTNFSGFTLAGTTAGTTYVVSSLGGVALSSTTYYFCIKAYDSTSQYSAVSSTVSLLPTGKWLVAPDLTTNPTASVKTKSATVTWSTSRDANSFVKYGATSGSYGNEVGSSDQVTSHSIKVINLSPGTKYYYQVLWTDEDGNQGTSSEYNFTTAAAPFVSDVKFSNININSAYVTFTIKNATKATLQYGKTTSYGSSESISTSTSETTYTIALSSLTEGTVYHLRIVAEDDEGNTYNSDDYNFETLPTPKIVNLKIQQVVGMPTATLRLLWTSNTLISSIVTYYPTANPERAADQISLALKKSHEIILKNILDDADYTLIVKGKDSAGNEATAETRKVTTATDIRAPEIINMNVESTIVGVGDSAKAQIIVSWDSDEPATTQVEYAQGTGTSYGQTTQEDTSLTLNHTVTIPGLKASTIYHLRAVSKDKAGNIAYSFDNVIVTPKSTKDALTLVIENLSKTFGFLKGTKIFK